MMKMLKGKNLLHICVMLAFTLLYTGNANAQVDTLIRAGDSLYRAYRFDAAVDAFDLALEVAADTSSVIDSVLIASIADRLHLAENGSNMSMFVRTPRVLGRQMCSVEDFHLYYPVEDKSWRRTPNQLDNDLSDKYVHALYALDWSDRHYYSAEDENGHRDIYVTELRDTLWSIPRKVEELSSLSGNEIYPMLSPDGKTIYFASNGLYGLGGYDLFVSTWDDEAGQWSMPQNMGIPFSSPDDDFLFIDTEDEKFSLFASTRDCPDDSVWVYALEYERSPLHTSVDDADELFSLSRLMPHRADEKSVAKTESRPDDLTLVYMAQMDDVRALKDSISVVLGELDELRLDLAFSNDETERYDLSATIIEKEKIIPQLQKQLEVAQAELQKTEYEFLKKGVFIDANYAGQVEEVEEDAVPEFEFVKRSQGGPLRLNFEIPEEKFDYSFRVLDEAVFAEDQSLLGGIVYQIQLFGGGRKAYMSELKGLSPVYEHRSPSGMYIYRVGRFSTYDEALECSQKVKKLGFKSAYICAFANGESISVAKARTEQERLKVGFALYEINILPESGELDVKAVDIINSAAYGKDLIRTEQEDGTQVFTVGPFDSKEGADALVEALRYAVNGKVVCEPIN